MALILESPEETMELGGMLAKAMADSPVRHLYLFAELGGGKTTLTRGFVRALPGNALAEVASPSFTLCNMYPTCPGVLHADLYRLSEGVSLPDEVHDFMEDGNTLMVLEWPQYLSKDLYAKERIDVYLSACNESAVEHLDNFEELWKNKRLAVLKASGTNAERLLCELVPRLEKRFLSDKT